ncbi:MAG: membrane dipeptidase [Gammaproteobacteria bacterium]|nr:membrane dipeptidase [Gammaproteobacteria bacterium]
MDRRQFLKITSAAVALGTMSSCANNQPKLSDRKRLYVDGLSFIPTDHQDVKASGLDAYIADISSIEEVKQPDGSINYKRTYQACLKSLKAAKAELSNHPDKYLIALRGSDIEKARIDSRCAVFFQIQGADCVEGGFDQLDHFYDLGLRALQLTHHYNNDYAGGALNLGNRGLTVKGHQLLERLEQKRMLIDLSHSNVVTAEQTLLHAKGPIVQTHGAARAIVNNARCSPDHIIKGIADSGGVFGVFMMSWWLTNESVPRSEHLIDHLRHIKNIAGVDAVAIANDYPLRGQNSILAAGNNNQVAMAGYGGWWQQMGQRGVLGFDREVNHIVIPELNHIKRMRSIEYLLKKSGFTTLEIDKVMGKNWQRVLIDVLG